jgi:tripartite ATP-independent transporter DctM subunit
MSKAKAEEPLPSASAGPASPAASVGSLGGVQRKVILLLDVLLAIALLSQLGIMFTNVVTRYLFDYQTIWGQEISMITLTMIAFIGGAVAYARDKHMAVEVITQRFPDAWQRFLAAGVDWLILFLAIMIGWLSLPLVHSRFEMLSPIIGMPEAWFMMPLPVGMTLMAIIAVQRLWARPRKSVVPAGITIATLIAALVIARNLWGPWGVHALVLWLTLAAFVVLLTIGVPIGFVLSMTGMLFLYVVGQAPIKSVPQTMYGGILGYVLLTIPFFVYAGFIMTEGGLSRRLAECVIALIGRLPGGLLQVIVVAMYIVSGISGSKVADVAAVGSSMKGMLKRGGYNMGEAAAVLAASAIMGETVPPSFPMLVLGSITSLSVGALFMAGLLPAAFMAVWLMVLIHVRARKYGMPAGIVVPAREAVRATLIAIPSLVVPVFLIGGIMAGVATPTEISSVAVVYALALGVIFYREMGPRSFWNTVVQTCTTSGMILFIISSAFAFSWSLSVVNLPDKIGAALLSIGGETWLFLLGTVITLVITGALLEGLPALLIFGPMLMPIAVKLGIHPLQYGIILIIAMGFGTFSPPIGIGVYVTCGIAETSMEDLTRRLGPYLIVLFLGMLVVTFVPWFSLVIPRLLHMAN